jgi:hypothetical protein
VATDMDVGRLVARSHECKRLANFIHVQDSLVAT